MIRKHLIISLSALLTLVMFAFASCNNNNDDDDNNYAQIGLDFVHYIDGDQIEFDTLLYTNAAGNQYMVYEIQYFISRLTLYKGGTAHELTGWKNLHYVDTDIPSTMTWDVFDELEPGTYDSLAFTFGMSNADNPSFMFSNPPENAMVWPEVLGGGYHYMKLNGKWLDNTNHLRGFAFHLGIGQSATSNQVDNSFRVVLPDAINLTAGQRTKFLLRMNVEEWFTNPYDYDHNVHGGDIMQNQAAMHEGCQNGRSAFELQFPLHL